MLIRRRFRIKAMQFLYVNHISSYSNSKVIENNMLNSIDKIYDLYICIINLLIALQNKAYIKKKGEK